MWPVEFRPKQKQVLQQDAYSAISISCWRPKVGHPWGYCPQSGRRPVQDVA